MKSIKIVTLIQIFAALALSAGLAHTAMAEAIQGAAPNFTLKSGSGKNIKLSELRGQVVMINFWASWCGPCRQEMPVLDQLYQRYKDLGFTVLGVNVDEHPEQAKSLLKDVPVTFPILFDSENSVSKLYNIKGMPTTVLVDRNGNMRHLYMGYLPGYEMEYLNHVRAMIRE